MMTTRSGAAVLLGALLLVSLQAAADSGAAVHEVVLKEFSYNPQEITIKVGDTVRWVNKERRQYHSVWFEALGEKEAQYFWPDETYERTFDKPGDYPYHCEPHPEMTGVIHVVE